ncbi:vacuolar-sorting protein snf7 [Nannizzia gypsea CBS 118893]|uniref:Vacuolar-sorting protein SNF7 n=1 Tax=Arthroderma gypseum (strain ATCC MYA-4604 / CBS 118893) TaxID=535722 RepID=E5R0T7_ARTGP|nr:vacuolar-sorting protein snf7 [Nannizzia gypsea CBS 118893]EFQ97593.1 vacuolar-sorting protein snf7 [Nannizzia gypsea CBS 118893]
MWSFFGGASAQKKKDIPKNAILSLREQLEMLQKREKHLQNQMDEQDAIARKNVTTNKNAAKSALRRKKLHERSLEQTSAQILQLEQHVYSIESANINQETFNAMKAAKAAMEQIHSGLNIEVVDETMGQLQEQHDLSNEIVNAITNAPIGEPLDEADLEAELEGMEQEHIDNKMIGTGTVPVGDRIDRLPSVANGAIKEKPKAKEEDDEEAELEKLRAEMAM